MQREPLFVARGANVNTTPKFCNCRRYRMGSSSRRRLNDPFNPFSAELFKVDNSLLGRLYFHVIGFLEYFYNSLPNNADFR